mgnify:CR=1 FL=1
MRMPCSGNGLPRFDGGSFGSTFAFAPITGVSRFGCGSIELAYVATGRLDAWLQPDSEPWDWNPGALLVREAGGVAEVAGRWHPGQPAEVRWAP